MRLRNRGVGVGETFYPFRRLPIELRQMIWRLSLEPRVVEVLWAEADGQIALAPQLEDLEHGHAGPFSLITDVVFFSLAKLPTALKVNQDSRSAVLPLYPLCFKSISYGAYVRFNFSLDTLYVDQGLGRFAVPLLINHKFMEAPRLQKIAVSEKIYHSKFPMLSDINWDSLIETLSSIASLKHTEVVVNVTSILASPQLPHSSELAIVKQQISDEFGSDYHNKGVELYENYPQELADRLGYTDDQTVLYTELEKDWVKENAKLVWGWRNINYTDLKGNNRVPINPPDE
ncbi:hypothetical protein BDZ45DRAFT_793208 [Acephala macrosclerotiorum]|nr:hypothetical protein BDZ45DRAFT_793208 [Acephala macrosclerotiorum]